MPEQRLPEPAHESLVVDYFLTNARYWRSIYQESDAQSLIYRLRREAVLELVDKLALPAGSRILEIGCGAGSTAVELARRGHWVEAVDIVPSMIEMTRQSATDAQVGHRLRTCLAAAERLPYPDRTFDLVLAVGLLPWLRLPGEALLEMARVLRPDAPLIATADNRWRLQRFLDPLGFARRLVGRVLRRAGILRKAALVRLDSPPEIDRLLAACGFRKVHGLTLGFGPFTALGFRPLPGPVEVAFHKSLQSAAGSGLPFIRSAGAHYVVLSRRNGEVRQRLGANLVADIG
jgi:ubiquinone/menaquinone biosynthesis C-methylase UbiE